MRNTWMSVDPYMRGRLDDRPSYVPPFRLGEPLDGPAAGIVVASRDPNLKPGDTVLHNLGWRDHAVLPAGKVRRVDPDGAPVEALLGVLGLTGLTAYVGLLDVATLRQGDVVFVSAAAGAVGSAAGQIAKLRGHRVIGSAGSAEKVRYLVDELGFDAAFNYRDGPVADLLEDAAPNGIDVYFDNVGGEHLEAAIGQLRLRGRVALCGFISGFDADEASPGPANMSLVVTKRLALRGFLALDHLDRRAAFLADATRWLEEGRLRNRTTVVRGIDQAAVAFLELLRGANIGKMLVRLD